MTWLRRRRKPSQPEAACDVIAELLTGYRIDAELTKEQLFARWRQLVGDRIASRTTPVQFTDGTLTVAVANSSWLHQLSLMGDQFAARINTALGHTLVTSVRLRLGRPSDRKPLAPNHRRRLRSKRKQTRHPTTSDAQIRSETALIDDDDLRAIIFTARRKIGL